MAKTMFCFNKNSAKNESQTIVSITQKHHYKTRLAAQQITFNLEREQNQVKRHFLTLDLKYGKKYLSN